ncbi:hypothetical protein SEPCBS57363_005232 [Sporothrix epigloea]|uniref:LIM zinc-binding domain-containing protein n=1 Tax=Sporothrix epigloea TaxID=1892477 RepID=A0ABP0E089_9PEZI
MDRPASFFPTIKCSSCGQKIEISLMGEHICSKDAEKAASPPPPSKFDQFMSHGSRSNTINDPDRNDVYNNRYNSNYNGNSNYGYSSRDQDRSERLPPKVDTSAANRSYYRAGQLTPGSNSSSAQSVSPRTPVGMIADGPQTGGLGSSNHGGDYFATQIAGEFDSLSQPRRPGGYGGFDPMDDYPPPSNSPKHQRPNVLQPLHMTLPGHSNTNGSNSLNHKPNSSSPFPRQATNSDYSRENTEHGNNSNNNDFQLPPINRAGTFPRLNESAEPPSRTPSAPGPRPDRTRRQPDDMSNYPYNTYGDTSYSNGNGNGPHSKHTRQPSMAPDTSRPPPPRTSLLRPSTSGRNGSFDVKTPQIDLAAEFGIGNPYHSASNSMSSTVSSVISRPGIPFSSSLSSLSSSSSFSTSSSAASLNHNPREQLRPKANNNNNNNNNCNNNPANVGNLGNNVQPTIPHVEPQRWPSHEEYGRTGGSNSSLGLRIPPQEPSQARDLYSGGSNARAATPLSTSPISPMPSRGNCKACSNLITGKSVSSADGRLTGRYHKACFVCFTCREPFTSATFYVHGDKPYCERHYHAVNGSLCGTCRIGIEGPYLADEADAKHHPNCFVCGDCKQSLRDGYFEVSGGVYCERDAQKRVQQIRQPSPSPTASSYPSSRGGRGGMGNSLAVPRGPPSNHNMSRRPFNAMGPAGPSFGPPNGNRLHANNLRPRMEKRITRLGMM